MKESKIPVIALLGQPNSGKSTLFNQLTGSKQHIGNWPGKTVERKIGKFVRKGVAYEVVDLPGSYSLSANSDEEVITRNYIANGNADLICVFVDASQLERSMYMLADYAGINIPTVVLLNMYDIAEKMGKKVDVRDLQKKLRVPVLPFVASDKKYYEEFFVAIERSLLTPSYINTDKLEDEYTKNGCINYSAVSVLLQSVSVKNYNTLWLASKCIEKDKKILHSVKSVLREDSFRTLKSELSSCENGEIEIARCKYEWINYLIQSNVSDKSDEIKTLCMFDKFAVSRIWGKPMAISIIFLALAVSTVIAMPFTAVANMIPPLLEKPLYNLLTSVNIASPIVSLISSLLPNILYFALSMSAFVIGITFVFSLIEEIGYMARVSVVFDSLMSKLGLQGKSIMAFFMGVGCTIGGVEGTRVIDNWGQRLLAMFLVWAVPCGATWAVMPTLAGIFFGSGSFLVMLAIVMFMFVVMALTANIFGSYFIPKESRAGMIMEMPPYHKPRWGHLVKHTLNHTLDIFKRAVKIIFIVSVVFWILSYSKDGKAENSIIYKVGISTEPITRFFGLKWQTFMAFVASIFSKEAVLGVLSSIYADSGSIFNSAVGSDEVSNSLAEILPNVISKAEALAFIFATTFNVPCIMALAATYRESHSLKWTVSIGLYYTAAALALSCIIYHIGLLIF